MTQQRLAWLCRRGMRELDLLLEAYLLLHYPLASEAEQSEFQRLLENTDDVLWRYLNETTTPSADNTLADLLNKIRRSTSSCS